MDKLEYIPGDLVMTNGVPLGTAKDVVYRVTSSDPSKTLELYDGTDTRYFDSKYTFKKESRFIPRLKNLYQKATIRWNKVNMPSANVSLFRSILRTSKECSRCKHFNGMLAGRCTKLHKYVESSDWCHGTFFHRK